MLVCLSSTRRLRLLQTIAHTLCFAFALLALYPDKQEKVYEEIKAVSGEIGSVPVRISVDYSRKALITLHSNMLTCTNMPIPWRKRFLATVVLYDLYKLIICSVLYETLRIFPPVQTLQLQSVIPVLTTNPGRDRSEGQCAGPSRHGQASVRWVQGRDSLSHRDKCALRGCWPAQ